MIEYLGRKYYLDRATGYYRTLMRHPDREYLHRAVWQHHHGNIPHGWEIHHKVEDRSTTNPADLECMPFNEHLRLHRASKIRYHFVCEWCGAAYMAARRGNRWCSTRCRNGYHNGRRSLQRTGLGG